MIFLQVELFYFVWGGNKRYKFTFNNVEITNMYQYWHPTRFDKVHTMKSRLYYYRSFIFGLGSEHADITINRNVNGREPSAALYGANGQCFRGEFIITANQKLNLVSVRDAPWEIEEFNKNDLCPLYLMLYDLFTHIDEVVLFNGTITFDSFKKDKNNRYKGFVNKKCPFKYTWKVKSKLVELKDKITSNHFGPILKLTRHLYTSNSLITSFINNPTIKQLEMPTHLERIDGTIEMDVMINKNDADDEKVDYGTYYRDLGVFPTSVHGLKKFALNDKNVMKLMQKLAKNVNDPKIACRSDLFKEGLIVHYYGGCDVDLGKSSFCQSPVPFELHATNGVLYIRYKDLIKEKYLKSSQNNSSTSGGLLVDGKKYILNIGIGCWESRIDTTSFVRHVTVNGNIKEIGKKIELLMSFKCKFVNPVQPKHQYHRRNTLNTVLMSLEHANKLQKQAKQEQEEKLQRESDIRSIHMHRLKQIRSDHKVCHQISTFFKKLIRVDNWSVLIVNNWNKPQVIELLYRSQLYRLIYECICRFDDNGELEENVQNVLCARDSQGWNILHYAAYLNDSKYINLCFKALKRSNRTLISTGIIANQLLSKQDVITHSVPIHIAAQYGHVRVLRELIESCPNVGDRRIFGQYYSDHFLKKTKDRWTALDLSIIHDQKECFEILFCKMEYCLHKNDYNGFTVGTLAAQSLVFVILVHKLRTKSVNF